MEAGREGGVLVPTYSRGVKEEEAFQNRRNCYILSSAERGSPPRGLPAGSAKLYSTAGGMAWVFIRESSFLLPIVLVRRKRGGRPRKRP